MVFFDTCVWFELTGVKSPTTPTEIRQATVASALMKKILKDNIVIVTCKEQLVEVISSVQKAKMKEYNATAKKNGGKGVGDIKSYRKVPEFQTAKQLCSQVIKDVINFSKLGESIDCPIQDIISNIHLVDINDYMYYEFCKNHGINLYTFDCDYDCIDTEGIVIKI
ncbi:MAG: PIN domain-containing protein [Eubacteriales bacterium]|nr:PIN domain-containing protein [Eubacteriales bacterium]